MKDLPYTKSETFTFRDQPYNTEEAVLKAAVTEALGNLGIATQVMRECCALAPLLARACELKLGKET